MYVVLNKDGGIIVRTSDRAIAMSEALKNPRDNVLSIEIENKMRQFALQQKEYTDNGFGKPIWRTLQIFTVRDDISDLAAWLNTGMCAIWRVIEIKPEHNEAFDSANAVSKQAMNYD